MEEGSRPFQGFGLYRRRSIASLESALSMHSTDDVDEPELRENFEHDKKRQLHRQATLTLITVPEDDQRIYSRMPKLRESPPPYREPSLYNNRYHDGPIAIIVPGLALSNRIAPLQGSPNESPLDIIRSFRWATFFAKRPILKLFLVIFFNGLMSMAFAAIFISLEHPAQDVRFKAKEAVRQKLNLVENNLHRMVLQNDIGKTNELNDLFSKYNQNLRDFLDLPNEIEWDMLASSAFVNAVSSTTGYGDIVPVTTEGKVVTVIYALYGVPVFMWYIIKLGALFRVLVIMIFDGIINFMRKLRHRMTMRKKEKSFQRGMANLISTVARPVVNQVPAARNIDLLEELENEKRFHPVVIGLILVVFLCSVAGFISHMETMTYFNAFYACFITYSTIGFGDIDIYRISYRSSWFNLMIYGNCIHIIGYMLISAWISAVLEKFTGKSNGVIE